MPCVPRIPPSVWRPAGATISSSAPLRGWLTDAASLTARMVARCERFSVRLVAHGLQRPHRDEATALHLRAGELAWVREVLLLADGVPCVYARSIVARQQVRRGWHMFSAVGSRSLGAVLFADPQVQRGPLQVRRLDRRDARYHRVRSLLTVALPPALWARRSAFARRHTPRASLIVCEIFLPSILDLPT